MDALETLVRDVLHEHAGEAPTVVPELSRRHRRWLPALAAALLVAGLAVAAVTSRGGGSTSVPPSTFHAPPGYRPLSYHGITLAVPKNLPKIISSCGTWQDAVVVSDGVGHGCVSGPPNPPQRHTQVMLDSFDPHVSIPGVTWRAGVIDGISIRRGTAVSDWFTGRPSPIGLLEVRALDFSLEMYAPQRSTIDKVLDSVQITPVDAVGCPDRLSGQFDPPVATKPSSVSVCEYGLGSQGSTKWLVASTRAERGQFAALTIAMRDRPDPSYPTPFVGVFRYPNGTSRFVPLTLSDLPENIPR